MLTNETLETVIGKLEHWKFVIDNQLYKEYSKEQLDQELKSIKNLQDKIRQEQEIEDKA